MTFLNFDILDFFIEIIKTFIGAFLGAFFAFKYEKTGEFNKGEEEKYEETKYAFFVLACQCNELHPDNQKLLLELESNPDRHRRLDVIHFTDAFARLDLKKLSFMLSGKQSDLLQTLHHAEQSFHSFLDALRDRNHLADKNSRIVNANNEQEFKLYTDALYEAYTRARSENKNALEEIAVFFEHRFPKFPKFHVSVPN
ncbi:MAG: hypothetical protein F9K49_04730 [Caedimonadaceae bacterium]|nr:MAG: hypothetical protein F9K49_04730 [Caedimonadaceae bacterium]